jgi:hypothetical protein
LIAQLTYYKICKYICKIISNIIWGKYKYGTILQLTIQLIHFKVFNCIYKILINLTLGKYEYGTILQLIELYSDGQVPVEQYKVILPSM